MKSAFGRKAGIRYVAPARLLNYMQIDINATAHRPARRLPIQFLVERVSSTLMALL
jgi:hypothetical protein